MSRVIDIRWTMSLADVLACYRYPRIDFLFANCFYITLVPQMVDVTVAHPDDAVSEISGAVAQVNFVAIVRQVRVETAQFHPETAAYEKGESVSPWQIHYGGL